MRPPLTRGGGASEEGQEVAVELPEVVAGVEEEVKEDAAVV